MQLRAIMLCFCLAVFAAALPGCGAEERPPRAFFGIDPQVPPSDEDAAYMRAGGIGKMRTVLPWGAVQLEPGGEFEWAPFDPLVAVTAKHGIGVLFNLYGMPGWLGNPKGFPTRTKAQREGWREFLQAAVARYGPDGSFWREHGPGSAQPLPKRPIRAWQIWNEPNYFYFATPIAPRRYARLVKQSRRALGQADPGAELVLGGLFGDPRQGPPRAMDAAEYLAGIYEEPGMVGQFDGVALHPYARDTKRLEALTEEFRRVADDNGDPAADLYVTEMGWGSAEGSGVSFEVGPAGQAEQLRDAYDYLLSNRKELRLAAVYWYSWRDRRGTCAFCDSSGLFEEGTGFEPKPAWEEFVAATGGRPEP